MADNNNNFFNGEDFYAISYKLQQIGAQLAHGFAFQVRKSFVTGDDSIMVNITHFPFEQEMAQEVGRICAADDNIMNLLIKHKQHYWKPDLAMITTERDLTHDLWAVPEFRNRWNALEITEE